MKRVRDRITVDAAAHGALPGLAACSSRRRARNASFSAASHCEAPRARLVSCSHQSRPISRALSTDITSSRMRTVRSSMSSRLTLMSPAITTPLSSTRSSRSARFGAERSSLRHRLCSIVIVVLLPSPAGGSTLEPPALTLGETIEKLVLASVELVRVQEPLVELPRQLGQLAPDDRPAVVLALRGDHHLVERPQAEADRRQGQQQQLAQEAH